MANEKAIWSFLKANGFTDAGAAGCMGNGYAESGLQSNIAETSYMKKMGITSQQYIDSVDNGSYPRDKFIHDAIGLGLFGYTFRTFKQELYDLAKSEGKSVGDMDVQLEYLIICLKKYAKNVLSILQSSNDVRQCSTYFLLNYERPADQSAAMQEKRYNFSMTYYNKYANSNYGGGSMATDSPLAKQMILSPNRTIPRQGTIKGIIPHCVVGQAAAVNVANMFAKSSRQASSTYVIGKDGEIVQCVPEKDRAWTSGGSKTTSSGWTGAKFDHWSVSIECASDTYDPYYMNDKVLESLVNLSVDICKRNGIPKLLWENDPSIVGQWGRQNVGLHRWFDYRACPGDYLVGKMDWYVSEVNKRLVPDPIEEDEDMTIEKFTELMTEYRRNLQAKDGSSWSQADREWGLEAGLFKGDENGKLSWCDTLTREQAAALFHRFADYIKSGK